MNPKVDKRIREGEDSVEIWEKRQSEIQMTSTHEDHRGIKKRDRFIESDEISQRVPVLDRMFTRE